MDDIINYGATSSDINTDAIITGASNIKTGTNPPYAYTDFMNMYPQFTPTVIPQTIVEMYINTAHACIKEARWHSFWQLAMGWFVAHFCTLYLQSICAPTSTAAMVIEAGKAKGLDVSQSVGDVSVSTDYNLIANDLNGWAAWKLTTYGQQLATTGRLVGKGAMYIV